MAALVGDLKFLSTGTYKENFLIGCNLAEKKRHGSLTNTYGINSKLNKLKYFKRTFQVSSRYVL